MRVKTIHNFKILLTLFHRQSLIWVLVLTFSFSAYSQEEGPAAVSSNGVTISFQSQGDDATASNGVTVSFQNEGGDVKASNGVTVSFQNEGGAGSGANRGVSIGFRSAANASYFLGRHPNSGTFADPVNTATGNFTFDKTDLTVPGRGIGFEFKRFYNSQDNSTGPLGANWTHSYNVFVTENTADNTATVKLDDGREEMYDRSGSSFAPKYPGIYNKLEKNSDNTYTLTQKDQRKYNFKANGKLSTIVDRNNNTAALNYDAQDRLSSVSLPGSRSVSFTYDNNNRITQITDGFLPSPRIVSYEYDENNNLNAVIDPNGKRYEYTYDAQHQMLTAKDPRLNTFVTNTYDSTRRVVTYQTDAKGNPTSFEYIEAEGRTKITDATGNLSYDYHDAFKRMIRRQDKNGNSYSYTYDANNNRLSVTDKNNQPTLYEYDAQGNVTKQTDPYGNTVTITYNSNNDPITRTDELGNSTTFEYDTSGNLIKTTEPLSKITTFTYTPFGQLETITDAESHLTTNTYDSFGNLIKITNHLNQKTDYGYDTIGRRISVTDALEHTTTFVYDKNGNLLSVTNPLDRSTIYEYDENNNRTEIIDPRGNITKFEFDENNLLEKTIDAKLGETFNTYNILDRLISVKDARSNITKFEYDADGRLIKVEDALQNITRYEYDAQGNRTKTIDPKGKETIFAYDNLNRLLSATDALGNKTVNTYDALGRLKSITDANNKTAQYFYDELGRLKKVTNADGKDAEYTYDKVGNRLIVKINNQTTTFTYDELNRLKTRKNPLTKIYEFNYDAVGNLLSRKDANSQITAYEYYSDNRLKKITYPSNSTVQFEYDGNGNRKKMTDQIGISSYTYDELNRLTNYVDAYGKSIGYEYDKNGNRTALIYPDGKRVSYDFDEANRLSTVTDWGNRVTTYGYDAASLLSGIAYANGTTAAFNYNFAQRLISMNNRKSDQTVISSYSFTLDGVGNRTNINATESITTGINQPNVSYTYNAANQIQTSGASVFTSDDNGNLKTQTTGASTISYNYDFEDRLTNVSGGAASVQYIYNGDGQRLARISGGVTTRFVIDPAARLPRMLAETDNAGNITNYYTHGLGLIARVRLNGQAFQYHFDQRGSTVAITNSSQTVVNRYAYDAFGAVMAQAEQTTNLLKYMGQFGVTAEPFDLLFASRRFYSPTLGRFLTKDPIEGTSANSQTFNEYVYSLNNPIVLIDPSGLAGQNDSETRFYQKGSSDNGHAILIQSNEFSFWSEFAKAIPNSALCAVGRLNFACKSLNVSETDIKAAQDLAKISASIAPHLKLLSTYITIKDTIDDVSKYWGVAKKIVNGELSNREAVDVAIDATVDIGSKALEDYVMQGGGKDIIPISIPTKTVKYYLKKLNPFSW